MKHAHILVVDDDPCTLAVLSVGLAELGARVSEASGISRAEALLAQVEFDLILSDVHLAGNDGLQWTEQLLADPSIPPLVLLTGNPDLATAMRAANLRVSGYLAKPCNLRELSSLLQRLLDLRRRHAELRRLADEAAGLLAGQQVPDPLTGKLERLVTCLAAESDFREGALTGSQTPWQSAIVETIEVLEKTRHSFRSKELGRLRRHLSTILENGRAA